MIARIIRGACAAPALTTLLVLGGAALGGVWLQDLPRDVFPDLSAPIFNVIVQNPALGSEELEVGIAVPLEAALAGLPDVRRIRSVSQLGFTQVTLEFEVDADYFRARQLVAERVAQVAGQLPAGTEPPLISSLTGRINEILEFTLEADPGAADLMMLRDLAEFDVRNRLLAVPGVAAVDILGGYLRQFQVQLDPDRMWARGITLDQVLHATEGANVNAAGGVVIDGPIEWTVRAVGRVAAIEDLRDTVVSMRNGTPVLLGDVADVREAPAVRRGLAHRLQGEVVSCRVVKQFGADTVKVAAAVRAAIAEIQRALPAGVHGHIVYDQSEVIDAALGGLGRAVLLGAVFVVVVIVLLLGNLRAALIVIATMPLSVALSGLALRPAGVGLNAMTLGGLAIAVGILVDAAIIVTENIWHRIAAAGGARPRRAAATAAAIEVGRPIAFATLIVVAVFVPLFGMSGIEGRMYKPLAAAVIAAVGAALALALTAVPMVAGAVLRPRRAGDAREVAFIRGLKRLYAPLLDACLRHAGWVRLGSLLITIPALLLALRVGSDFMPRLDEGAFMVLTYLPPEASLEEVDRLNHRLEDLLREVPEVADVLRRTGRGERTEDPMPHTMSDVLVILRRDRQRPTAEILRDIRGQFGKAPGLYGAIGTPLTERIDEAIGGTPADLVVSIFGPDLDQLATLAEQAREIVGRVAGIADLRVEAITGLPQLRVAIDRAAVARVGLTPGDVVRALRVGLAGEEQSQVWIGQRHWDLVVRLQDHRRDAADALRTLLVDAHDGTRIPLGQLAAIDQTFGPAAIRREAGSRRIAVEASVFGRDLGSTAAEVQRRIARDLTLPPGYFFTIGGRVESQARATRALLIAIAAALIVVFVLLQLAVGSAAEALIVLATLPDAFVGGIAALLIAGETWNVSSLVGLIALFGIAVQNGLVLITQTKLLVADGKPFAAALREASIGRVRPKILTAATAILGLLPLLVLPLHGTEIERPLAVVMIGGLITSTLFTLLALPTFYMWVHRLRR